MKKRAFLSPLAAAVAALLSTSPTTAAINPEVAPAAAEPTKLEAKPAVAAQQPFVIERSDQQAIKTAYHSSHRSHYSHRSHSSHYSSRY